MSPERPANNTQHEKEFGSGQITLYVLRVPFLRNILIACLAVAVLFPLYNWLYLKPSYRQILSGISEEEAQRISAHLVRMLDIGEQPLSDAAVGARLPDAVRQFQTDFELDRFKLYDPDAKVIYSTDPEEIGRMNRQSYFLEKVRQGKIHSRFAVNGASGRQNGLPAPVTVIVCVPVMHNEVLQGAVEFHFDIARAKLKLDNLLRRSDMALILIALTLMVTVGIILMKAGSAMLQHRKIDRALDQARNQLERRIQERTMDLIDANKELQMEVLERKQAEKALLDNLQFMTTLIDTIPNPVFYKDADGKFLGCNTAYAETLGMTKDNILGRRLIDVESIISSDMAQHYHRQDMRLIENPGIQSYEERIRCADGVCRDYIFYKATFKDAEGLVAGLVGIMLDISDRKKVEKDLADSKNLFDAFMQHLPGLAFMKDLEGKYIYVNEAFSRFTGKPARDQIGSSDDRVWETETARLLQDNDQKVLDSKSAQSNMETVRLPDEQERHLLTARFPVFQDNELVSLGGISIDITQRTQAQQQRQQLELQLQQAQKMEALGTLAGGIAHDFNNILAAIIGYSEIAVAESDEDSSTQGYLKRVLEAGERAQALVKQILAFSRQGEIEPKPVQVKLIVKEVLKLLRASLPATIEIVQKIDSDAMVMADPTQIHQVMMNLTTNAGYAMSAKGGTLTVSLRQMALERSFTDQHTDIEPGLYLKLTVSDTGTGIAPEHLNRVFDPFFTTKPKGEGTGMGLAVVHGIVSSLNGAIRVESTPEVSTRFEVFLPVIEDPQMLAHAPVETLPVGKERILFVDDEVFQTDMLKQMLGLLGYQVTVRNQSPAALELFKQDPHAFDLVITDMIMPELTGDQLAVKMLELRPDLPIILATGYSARITEAKAKALGIRAYALKPLVMEKLAKMIRTVIDDKDAK
jgi:PAS domain S-box-containing protein